MCWRFRRERFLTVIGGDKLCIQSSLKLLGDYQNNTISGILFLDLFLVAFFVFMLLKGANGIPVNFLIMLVVNALLYPYSRFVYESVVGFVIGNNVFISSALFMLAVKLFMMVVCFFCVIFIAPVGLVYLYFYWT